MSLILHPTDGSEGATKALSYAAELATRSNSSLLVLHVQQVHGRDRIPPDLKEFARLEQIRITEADLLRGAAQNIVARAARDARAKGVTSADTLVVEGDPARAIVETAKAREVSTIVMGSRGLGDLEGLLLGSVSHKVAHLAPCTCIIVR